jgi:autotransporter-associated beta strand protein
VGSNGLSTTVSGVIADGGGLGGTGASLVKTGAGTLTLAGANTYTGVTTVNAGTLAVTGSLASPVTVGNGGTLAGTGTVNNTVALTSGGTLGPGLSVGTLSTGSVTFSSGAVFAVEIDGTGSDRLNVTGAVTLNGATLSLSLLGGYVHTTGTVYMLVAGNPVVGTFSGLPEGATVTASGKTFRISYVGGVTLTATAATHLSISAPASATAGTAFSFTVTALDQFNSVATSYTGTVHFTSTDGQAVLPANSTLTGGTGTFTATLKTAGSQTITGTDTVTASITGTSNTIAVSAAVTGLHYTISVPASATASTAFSFTATARDQFNNVATGYTGTVHFTSTDGQAVLPANSTLTGGTGTFSATLKTPGSQTLTGTDTVTPSITGTSGAIAVSAGAATHLQISPPATAAPSTARVAGTAFSFTVTALDQFNNVATGYTGTVHFTSSDPQATLPADSTLTNGVGTFTATLRTAGSQAISARDTANSSITGTSNAIVVSPAAATHFSISAPTAATGAFSFTVTALDAFNNVATGYTGTVHFTSSDPLAVLPADATLTNGVGTFSATLRTGGNQTLTATDTVNSSITGSITISATPVPIPALSTWVFLLLAVLLATTALRALPSRGTR